MGSVIFDFDSTLVSCEGLEEILRPKLDGKPELMEQVETLTKEAMAGRMLFGEALAARLAIAAPSKDEVETFGEQLHEYLTPGMEQLVFRLKELDVDSWIISGGLREAILPVAKQLGIPEKQVGAVQLRWDEDGSFAGLDPADPFAHSKLAGARTLCRHWSKPVIGVGDGMTDYDLYQHGLVQHFIIYAEHVQRKSVIDTGAPLVESCDDLWEILRKRFRDDPILS